MEELNENLEQNEELENNQEISENIEMEEEHEVQPLVIPNEPAPYVPTEKELIEKEIQECEVEIGSLLNSLNSFASPIGDWKIIKCYEASLLNQEMPYDLMELQTKRQEARNRINELQNKIEPLKKQLAEMK